MLLDYVRISSTDLAAYNVWFGWHTTFCLRLTLNTGCIVNNVADHQEFKEGILQTAAYAKLLMRSTLRSLCPSAQ